MMSIVLFALIGAAIHASVSYWIIYGLYCAFAVMNFLIKLGKSYNEQQKDKEKE